MHGGVQPDSFIWIPSKFVLFFEDFNQFERQIDFPFFLGLTCFLQNLHPLFHFYSILLFIGILTHLQKQLIVVYLFQFLPVFFDCAADQPMLLQLLGSAIFWVDQGVDWIRNLACRVEFMELSLYSLFWHLSAEFDRGHVGEPEILAVTVESHLLFQLFFGFVVTLVHHHVYFEGEFWQKGAAVPLHNFPYLFVLELGQEIHYKFLVVLEADYSKFLKNMSQVHHLRIRRVHHCMKRIHFQYLRANIIFHNLCKNVNNTVIVYLLKITMIHTFLFLF